MKTLKAILDAVMDSPGKVKKPTMMSDITRLRKQVEVAADALREIECLTNDRDSLPVIGVHAIHELAQDGYRAAKGEGK